MLSAVMGDVADVSPMIDNQISGREINRDKMPLLIFTSDRVMMMMMIKHKKTGKKKI